MGNRDEFTSEERWRIVAKGPTTERNHKGVSVTQNHRTADKMERNQTH